MWPYTKNELASVVAARLPRRVRYWVTVQSVTLAVNSMGGDAGKITVDEMVDNLDTPTDGY